MKTWLALLLVSLPLLAAAAPPPPAPPSVAPPATPAPGTPSAAALRRDEVRLLHQGLRPIDLGANLRIFEPRAGEWLPTESSDPPAAKVIVVYLWSAAAPTAVAEIGWIRDLARRLEGHHGGDARFLFIAEGVGAAEMRPIAAAHPVVSSERQMGDPYFLDPEGTIAETLRQALPGATLPLPVTLILDDRRVVRHAIVGSLQARRGELVSAVSDLLYQLRANRSRQP